ncbi:MAG: hypothetical protein FJ279_13260 [Planctomycetes bacterium]|nr:hypothetical protein [Planctomycetota bacterium]
MTSDYLSLLIQMYRNTGVIYDTNVLLLYFCGLYDTKLITAFRRLSKYTLDDFVILCRAATLFRQIVTTPHILSEVSNLLDDVPLHIREDAYKTFAAQLTVIEEVFLPATEVAKADCFGKLGLSDSGIRLLSQRPYLVLTDDFPLLSRLQSLGVTALNFNHLRGLNWFGNQ